MPPLRRSPVPALYPDRKGAVVLAVRQGILNGNPAPRVQAAFPVLPRVLQGEAAQAGGGKQRVRAVVKLGEGSLPPDLVEHDLADPVPPVHQP